MHGFIDASNCRFKDVGLYASRINVWMDAWISQQMSVW